ncbi:hypothetical protein BZG02_16815 [Labilibaculum filiforme]|uniref:Alkyl hydroperoxide reductase subunit C/ Thiol specific antioxidant domain-containing protein n=1 Tax=Labilibaculum filiforme TaxID=1940526 RepID=A0A2N3HST0_9BACT|nr:hypothetical protein [Labilibaculum filiforme]PKQ61106.1 hypothetical protein BZG02_16815 [Labilibaculum filiforme]
MIKSILIVLFLCICIHPNLTAQNTKRLKPGDIFPQIKGELLSSELIILPDHCKGKVSVLIIAFKRGTQVQIDTWTTPLLKEFSVHKDFRFIEIPMISNLYDWMSHYINNGMRGGIDETMHKNVMTYYGPLNSYFDYFDVQDKKLCYLFLLDKEGKIQHLTKGKSKPEELSILFQKIKNLLNS